MIEHAKEDLYRNAQLQDNQEIANVTVSETFSTAILFSNKKIEIYADVIEWVVDSTENKPIINRAKSFEKNKTNDDQEKIITINACYSPSSSVLKKYKSDYEIKVGDVVHLTLEKKVGIITSIKDRIYTIECFDKYGNKIIFEKIYSQFRKVVC